MHERDHSNAERSYHGTVPGDMDLEIHFSVPHLVKGLVCPLVAGDDVVQVAANEIPNLGTYGGPWPFIPTRSCIGNISVREIATIRSERMSPNIK